MSVVAAKYQLKKPVNVTRPRPDHRTAKHRSDKQRLALEAGAITLDEAIARAGAGQVRVSS